MDITDLKDENDGFGVIPEGRYSVSVVSEELRTTKKGDGRYLEISFRVERGAHKGARLYARFNIENRNQTAVSIGKRELLRLLKAAGAERDTSELVGKRMFAFVEHDGYQGKTVERVTGFEPLRGGEAGGDHQQVPF